MPSACHCLSSEDAMAYDVPPPEQCPEPGYYYHYKHDPNGPLNNYAYYIYGVGHHTEDDCRPEDAFMQVYRPLYETAYGPPERRDVRPCDRSTCSTNRRSL